MKSDWWFDDKQLLASCLGVKMINLKRSFTFQKVSLSETHTVCMNEMELRLCSLSKQWQNHGLIGKKQNKTKKNRSVWSSKIYSYLTMNVKAGLQDNGIHYNNLSIIKTYKEKLTIIATVKCHFLSKKNNPQRIYCLCSLVVLCKQCLTFTTPMKTCLFLLVHLLSQ